MNGPGARAGWGLALALLASGAAARQSVLNPAGPVAAEASGTAWLLIVGAAVVFALVMAVLALALWRRRRDGWPQPGDAAWLVGAGVLFPGVVLAALLATVTLRSERLGLAASAGETVVSVTARMWWWEVRYVDPRLGPQVVLANEIRLPARRPVTLGLNSADVIHSFWVPALAGKWRGRLQFTGAALFILGFLFIFVLGGLTGVMVAVLPFDWQVHDTYFIVAHLHYVLIGGMVFPVIAAIYHWAPLVNGHTLSERLTRWTFWLMFGGFNLTFFPMHVTGLLGMPRRVATYAGDLGWNGLNLLSSVGAAVFAAGVALFVFDAVRTLVRKPQRIDNPWQAASLEWLPNEDYGNRSIPQIESREPLWDRPSLAAEVEAGRHWLPGTALGGRETLVTSPGRATPWHLLTLPGDSWWPLVAGFGTAAFFLLLTVKLVFVAWCFGALTVLACWVWMWQNDRAPAQPTARVGEHLVLPVGARHTRSHSWWATVVLIVVDLSIFASLAFAHVHVSLAATVCPPPGSRLPDLGWDVAGAGLSLASAGVVEWLRRRRRFGAGWRCALLVAATLFAAGLAGAGWAANFAGHAQAGLAPTLNAWSASIGALVGYQGLHAVLLGVMAVFLAARLATGLLRPQTRATLDNTALWWHATVFQALAASLLVQVLPALVR